MRKALYLNYLGGLLGALGFSGACAMYSPSGSGTVVNSCFIPADQSGTITGHWTTQPIPVALYQGTFDSGESTAITTAADLWNAFFTSSLNITTLTYGGNSSSPTISTTPDPTQGTSSVCNQSILQGTKFTSNVVLYKLSRWPASYPPTAMALTTTCFLQATPYPTFYMAIMELNYQSFFVQGTKIPDLESIVLHEFGHLHGLNHSCEASPKTGTPNCTEANISTEYLSASMFPTFSFDANGNGQQRRSLGANDEERANCLYSGPNGPAPVASSAPLVPGS
jgi:hypothetical protein